MDTSFGVAEPESHRSPFHLPSIPRSPLALDVGMFQADATTALSPAVGTPLLSFPADGVSATFTEIDGIPHIVLNEAGVSVTRNLRRF